MSLKINVKQNQKYWKYWTTRIPTQRMKWRVFHRKMSLRQLSFRFRPWQNASSVWNMWKMFWIMWRLKIFGTIWKLFLMRILNQVSEYFFWNEFSCTTLKLLIDILRKEIESCRFWEILNLKIEINQNW